MGNCCKKKKRKTSLGKVLIKEEDMPCGRMQAESIGKQNGNNSETDSNLSERNREKIKVNINDFVILKLIGQGSFAKVFLVRYKKNCKIYAMKCLDKQLIKQNKQQHHTITEWYLMKKYNHPFIVNLYFSFQDTERLYFIMDFAQGGELYFHLHNNKIFESERVKFYVIEIVIVIEYLHKNDIIYRDLKPENVLIDKMGHIKLTDFGLSKMLNVEEAIANKNRSKNSKAFTICGTPQYLAPEILKEKGYDESVDWFSLGCLMYEMLTGTSPFKLRKSKKFDFTLFEDPVSYPSFLTEDEKNLIMNLIVIEPKYRLGYGKDGADKIKKHNYFKDVDWDLYAQKKITPPFIPQLSGEEDVKYIDKCFTEDSLSLSDSDEGNKEILNKYDNYINFSYANDSNLI